MKPDRISYNCIINCWAKSGAENAHCRAKEILNSMKHNYGSGDKVMQPNVISYASCKAGDDIHAEELLEEMYADYEEGNESAKPNARSLCTVLSA
jgi:hypothetical protein